MAIYNGFSTVNRTKKYRINDFEVAKQDLYNHLHIRKGEKLMNPNFGTIIWGVLFEPLTLELKEAIAADLTTIVKNDPRIATENIVITEFEHGLQLAITLRYINTDQRSTLNIKFDRGT